MGESGFGSADRDGKRRAMTSIDAVVLQESAG